MNQYRALVKAHISGGDTQNSVEVKENDKTNSTAAKPAVTPTKTSRAESVVITMDTIRKGDKGTQVKVMQWLLSLNGYNVGTIDGIFGSNTLKAVKAYQTAKGLEVDGVVGKNTWTKLLA